MIAAAASALALGEAASGQSADAREHRAEALGQIERLVGRGTGAAAGGAVLPRLGGELPRALRRRDRACRARHRDRARHRPGAAARAADARSGLPVRDAGTHGGGDRDLRDGSRDRAARRQPPLPVLGAVRARLGAVLRGASRRGPAACEESLRVGGRLAGGTMPSAGGGPGWALAVCRFEAGNAAAMLETMRGLGDDDLGCTIPVEGCFDWEILALAELALGRPDAADAYAARGHATRRCSTCSSRPPSPPHPRGGPARHRRCRGGGSLAAHVDRRGTPPARGCRQRSPAVCAAGHWPPPATAARPSRAARGRARARRVRSVRPRDEMRRELRRLGARASRAGPRRGESGLTSLTKRELRDRRPRDRSAHEPRDRRRRSSSATRRSSRTCATSS